MHFRALGRLACMALALSIGFEGTSFAQSRRTAGVGSLLEMKCYGGDGWKGALWTKNQDGIIINRRPYTGVGAFAVSGGGEPWGVRKGDVIDITCDLAGRNRASNYRNLTMAVGMNEQSSIWNGRYAARIRLTTYTDGQYAGSTEVGISELKRFSLDISGIRSVSFSVECFQPSANDLCPSLWILEDKLY